MSTELSKESVHTPREPLIVTSPAPVPFLERMRKTFSFLFAERHSVILVLDPLDERTEDLAFPTDFGKMVGRIYAKTDPAEGQDVLALHDRS